MASKRDKSQKSNARTARGRQRKDALVPAPPPRVGLPDDYMEALSEIKDRIQQERLRVVLSANAAMVQLYWDIGNAILARQSAEGWGSKVIDRLSADLRASFPDMRGLSPRNLKYMRAFAAAWPDRTIVQRIVAQLPWRHNIALLGLLNDQKTRLRYAEEALRQGWSQPILCVQIDRQACERQGKAITNFPAGRFRHGGAGPQRPVSLRLSRHRRSPPGTRG
jgi:predicted nuclease of restriction endonuclease-like (RecB) superfamily